MTLKKSLRTAQKVTREIDKVQRAEQRTDKNFEKAEAQLLKKPISTLGIIYDPVNGLSSRQFDIETAAGILHYGPIDAHATTISIDPPAYSGAGVTIEPLDLLHTNWVTLVPIRVANDNPGFRPTVNWVMKTEKTSSSIFLLDPENGEYYYPIETDFTGDVVEGHPRSGIFAFEPFRYPTSRVELHLSGVRLGPARSAESRISLKFVFEQPELEEQIEGELQKPGIADFLRQGYAEQSGCSVAAMLFGSGLLSGIAGIFWFVSML